MRISTRGDYACRALLSLRLHQSEDGPTSVRDIATRTALPQPYLEQILLALKGAGLVKSKRGVGGGYILARPASEIYLSEIISAVDGPISVGDSVNRTLAVLATMMVNVCFWRCGILLANTCVSILRNTPSKISLQSQMVNPLGRSLRDNN